MYHVRLRNHHPGIGRWLSRDPEEYRGEKNLYVICGNALTNAFDPFGDLTPHQWRVLIEMIIYMASQGAHHCDPEKNPRPPRPPFSQQQEQVEKARRHMERARTPKKPSVPRPNKPPPAPKPTGRCLKSPRLPGLGALAAGMVLSPTETGWGADQPIGNFRQYKNCELLNECPLNNCLKLCEYSCDTCYPWTEEPDPEPSRFGVVTPIYLPCPSIPDRSGAAQVPGGVYL
jgi:hypothetical protein